ncbi:MAG: PEP-CTERM sorting domain-containing protein [Leptospirillum sp.]
MNIFISTINRIIVGFILLLMIVPNAKATMLLPSVSLEVDGAIGFSPDSKSFAQNNGGGSSSASGSISFGGSNVYALGSFLPNQLYEAFNNPNNNFITISGKLQDWIHFSGLVPDGYITENIYSFWSISNNASISDFFNSNIFNNSKNGIGISWSNSQVPVDTYGPSYFKIGGIYGSLLESGGIMWNVLNNSEGSNLVSLSIPTNDIISNNNYIFYLMGMNMGSFGGPSYGNTDPLISFIVPQGVTLTSGSGYNYLNPINPNSTPPSATPEPSTWLLFGTGVLFMGFMGFRKRNVLVNKA